MTTASARATVGPTRVGGLSAMRALAHPTRVRMMQLLRSEPLSASELARRLGIRFGSAQYHLRSLERAGIARKVGEHRKRGGTELLYEVPRELWVDVDAEAPLGMRQATGRAYLAELQRRLDAAAAEPGRDDTDRDIFSTRELELPASAIPAASDLARELLDRLERLAVADPTDDSEPFTVSLLFFRIPRSASDRPGIPGSNR